MPETLRFRDRRITLRTAVIISVAVLSGLQVVVGYGNDFQSCHRTAETRRGTNDRIDDAVAFQNGEADAAHAAGDFAHERRLRAYALTLNQDKVDVPDCFRLPPAR